MCQIYIYHMHSKKITVLINHIIKHIIVMNLMTVLNIEILTSSVLKY